VNGAIGATDLWTGSLYKDGCAVIGEQVVARFGSKYTGLRIVESPVSAAVENRTCKGKVGLVCQL